MPKIYIAYTGGTIGMVKTKNGFQPKSGYLEEKLLHMEELKSPQVPDYDFNEYEPLLDSANIVPNTWVKIARDIAGKYENYDGFVILHGTDTMAYTASALSFLLQGINKPVIFTGSQIPLQQARNDARGNLITSMILAGNYNIPEVCLFFGNKLLRGCRSVKVSADGFHAFTSPDFPPLGTTGVEIDLNTDLYFKENTKSFMLKQITNNSIAALRIFPGISANVLENIIQPPLCGLILQVYGQGNIPHNNKKLIEVIKKAVNSGIVVTACTQNLSGKVRLDTYETGYALAEAGVIGGYDITIEAALSKLYFLFSLKLSINEIKKQFQQNICGELTTES